MIGAGTHSAQALTRILDANHNRAMEGLRVCEEIARFLLEHHLLTRRLRAIRHELGRTLGETDGAVPLVAARNVRRDMGRAFRSGRYRRGHWQTILLANASRVKEALRVLEEFGRLRDDALAHRVQRIRFRFYDWEQAALAALVRLRYH